MQKHHFIYRWEGARDRYLRVKWFIQGEWWTTKFGRWLCRRGGHWPGVVWFNTSGLEPNMHCKRCGEDLG